MRLSLSRLAGLAALLALYLAPSTSRAEPLVWAYSATVAGGVIIDSGAQDVSAVGAITCIADNTAGGSARNLNVIWLADDKTTVLYTNTTSVNQSTVGVVEIGLGATAATGITPVPAPPGRWMKFQLAAGGAAAGKLSCFGR